MVSPGQGSALAQGVGRDVVAVMPGQGGRGPQWMVFGADGSARPVGGSGGLVPAGGGLGMAGLADSSAVVAVSGQETVAGEETPAAQARSVVGDAEPGATVRSATDTMRDTGGMPVRQWSAWDLRREIDGARQGAGLVMMSWRRGGSCGVGMTLGRWWARWWGILPNPVRAGWGGSVWRCGVRG
ncbi:hypothetical protein [Saccharopolyspora spinosa]|uniref:hypothetical protein n=1 Tax=Saccharopolyspora spinosa TaxID=60894 RepID=UPI003747D1B9